MLSHDIGAVAELRDKFLEHQQTHGGGTRWFHNLEHMLWRNLIAGDAPDLKDLHIRASGWYMWDCVLSDLRFTPTEEWVTLHEKWLVGVVGGGGDSRRKKAAAWLTKPRTVQGLTKVLDASVPVWSAKVRNGEHMLDIDLSWESPLICNGWSLEFRLKLVHSAIWRELVVTYMLTITPPYGVLGGGSLSWKNVLPTWLGTPVRRAFELGVAALKSQLGDLHQKAVTDHETRLASLAFTVSS